ncbi:hypothetical protein JCM33374_g3375 [Metschnikowia sp. JCM 33374]|nr:hypothetical protein JCM33374_g3375 [Metschnikowia sp. JCM 33374]
MSTKDVNERSREAAYGLLIQMGRKMQEGGVLKNSLDTAISCIVYEFKDDLPQDVLIELASTVELLTHNSREIAQSAIGFGKVEVFSLPEEFIRANLNEMLGKLMRWSHEHRNQFKPKVKHIVERLIRRFGIEAVEQAIPEEDRKLVANIKKTKARAKKRDDAEKETEGKTDGKSAKKFMSAYEEAVYDCDSGESEDEAEPAPSKTDITQVNVSKSHSS